MLTKIEFLFCAVQYNQEFGYSRKDVLLIGLAFIGVGYALYYGAQAVGIEATTAGNYVQLLIFLIICVGYISTYIFRVANKVRVIKLAGVLFPTQKPLKCN